MGKSKALVAGMVLEEAQDGERMGGGWWGREGDTHRAERQSSTMGKALSSSKGFISIVFNGKTWITASFLIPQ